MSPLYISMGSPLSHHHTPRHSSLGAEKKNNNKSNCSKLISLSKTAPFCSFFYSRSMEVTKRVRDDSDELALESSEAKRLRDDLLEFLDDADPTPPSQDLDSVMRSLQEEIAAPFVDPTSASGESQPQIGFLLEASDDELGLPPTGSSLDPEEKNEEAELVRVASDSSGIGELWGFENQIPSYDSFELGTGEYYITNNNNDNNNNNTISDNYSEYVAFDGIFDNSDVYYDDSASPPEL
ncbi:hypothetical protein E2542_SST05637 [Spatholobus suberectus]|nr:hypothetical protein E2542_SST05637 [Spatholobus suberectus]